MPDKAIWSGCHEFVVDFYRWPAAPIAPEMAPRPHGKCNSHSRENGARDPYSSVMKKREAIGKVPERRKYRQLINNNQNDQHSEARQSPPSPTAFPAHMFLHPHRGDCPINDKNQPESRDNGAKNIEWMAVQV